jgi:OmcA/MtrC family decaheme c-type cytochrome
VAHALPPIEAVSNIVVGTANAGADLTVTFDLAADGVAATNYDEAQRGYRTDGLTRTDVCGAPGFGDPNFGDPCDPAQMTLTDNTGGNYTLTVFGEGAEGANDNRWLFRVGVGGDSETRVYFYVDSGAVRVVEDLAISAQSCNACHGPEGIDVHGGYFAANDGGEPCLTCHGVDTTPSLAVVGHGYHIGVRHWRDPATPTGITFPTYMNNCSVCHDKEAGYLAAANAMPVVADACFTCHGDASGIPFEGSAAVVHANITGGCEACHAGQIPDIPQTVADAHNGAITERDGIIWDGEDTSVTEGAKFDWQITSVVDDGTDLTITWTATYDDGAAPVGLDPCNADPAAGPVFFADADPTADPPVDNGDNLSILRNYAQGQDFILGNLGGDRAGQPGGTPGVNNDNTTCDNGVATTVVPVEATDAMYGRVAIQGKPRILNVDPTPDPDFADEYGTTMPVRAVTPTYDWVIGDGAAAPARRAVVDSSLCLNCHVGSLYQHGGNRVDNVDMCMLCHNVAANDEYVRVDEFGVDASESYDGRAGQAFGMKELAHGVHPAGATGNRLAVYRGRGIYAWATSVDQLNNWPSGDNCTQANGRTGSNYFTVVGSEDAPETGSDTCQPHTFHAPTFPRGLYDCAACHAEGFASLFPNATLAMATTVEAGAPPFGDQLNDVLQGVQTTSCISCHADSAAKAHAYQNSWVPQDFPEGRQTIIDAN